MVLIAQHPDRTRLQHQRQPHPHLEANPPLRKRPETMPMRNDHDIRLSAIHMRRLHVSNPRNNRIKPGRELRRTLAALAPIMPDIPLPLPIQAPLPAAISDLRRQQALVEPVLPLAHVLADLDARLKICLCGLGEEELEGAAGACARAYDDLGEFGGVDELAGADDDFAGLENLGLAEGGQGDVAAAGVAAGDGPFCLALRVLA